MNVNSYPWKRAVIVGASSGIGEAIALELGRAGCRLAIVARRESELKRVAATVEQFPGSESVLVLPRDVGETDSAQDDLQEIAHRLGGLDLIVYAAGIMPAIGQREYPTPTDLAIIRTNLEGAIAWLNAAAARFDRVGEGTIVGISSVAGDRGRRGNPAYCASKAALNSYLASLRARLVGRGGVVMTVKPGFVRTALLGDIRTPVPAISSDKAARQILAAAATGKRVVYVPSWWRWIMLMVRAIPAPIFDRLPVP